MQPIQRSDLLHQDECRTTYQSSHLIVVGDIFRDLFCATGNELAIDVALSLYQAVMSGFACVSAAGRLSCLTRLGNGLRVRYSRSRDGADLEEAISLSKQALVLASSSEDQTTCLWILGSCLRIASENLCGETAGQLDEAISMLRQALCSEPSPCTKNIASILATVDLGAALIAQYAQTGRDLFLQEAVHLLRGLDLEKINEADRIYGLVFLMNALRIQGSSGSTIVPELIDESITVAKCGLTLRGDWHYSLSLMELLGRAYLDRFDYSGNVSDLDDAIHLYRNTLKLDHVYHSRRPTFFISFSAALSSRFSMIGASKDLEESIHCLYTARSISETIEHKALTAMFLADALQDRFAASQQKTDLEEAIQILRDGYTLSAGYLVHHRIGCDLAYLLIIRHRDVRNSSEDLGDAISLLKHTLEATEGSTHTSSVLMYLGQALRLHFEYVKSTDALVIDEAFAYHRRAASLFLPGHHFHNAVLYELVQDTLAEFSCSKVVSRHDEAMSLFRSLMEDRSSTASTRFAYANGLVHHYSNILPLASILEIYRWELVLLPQYAYIGLEANAPSVLLQASELANKAAMHALDAGREVEAVEFIELGRAVFWNKALQLRTRHGLLDLPDSLSSELLSVSRDLEILAGGTPESEESLTHRRRLADRHDDILHEIREIPGHEEFLLPATFSRLRLAGQGGYIVILLAADAGYKAVILRACSPLPQVLHLPNMTLKKVAILSSISSREGQNSRNSDQPCPDMDMEPQRLRIKTKRVSTIESLLEDLWRSAVHPIIQALEIPNHQGCADRPRLFWCPTGRCISIPLHAAGVYSEPGGVCAADYVVQSYIPTIGAILHAQRPFTPAPHEDRQDDILLVAQPHVVGYAPLPQTVDEVNLIAEIVGNATLLGSEGNDATVQAVSSALASASVVHLACHGQQDTDALRSGFLMKDGLLTVADLMRLELPNAKFAFLSACHAAAINPDNPPDEVLHLAATMLYSGFRSIIATMWSMSDVDGPAIARVVYTDAFKDGCLDLSRIPYALDAAVQRLKEEGVPASRWATYIHIGM